MVTDATVQDRSYTMSDLEVALGSQPRSGVARKVLARLEHYGVPMYDDMRNWAASRPGDRPEATAREAQKEKLSWHRFSLPGMIWVVLMDRVVGIPGMKPFELTSLMARFQVQEMSREGGVERDSTPEVPQANPHRAPTFAEYVRRLLAGESEPYLAIVVATASKMGAPERTSLAIPENIVISDNPAIIWDLYAQVATRFAGDLHVFPFRSVSIPVLLNLQRARGIGVDLPEPVQADLRRKAAGLPELPQVPAYHAPVEPDAKLTKAEKQLLDVVRCAPDLVPDIWIRAHNHEIASFAYEQSYSPKEFSVRKALEDDRTVQVRTIRGDGGTVRKYVVEKRVTF